MMKKCHRHEVKSYHHQIVKPHVEQGNTNVQNNQGNKLLFPHAHLKGFKVAPI
jgi:hypothetical protein